MFRDDPGHDGLSTFDDVINNLHAANGYPHVDRVVPVRPLASILLGLGVSAINFPKVDVEGLEAVVPNFASRVQHPGLRTPDEERLRRLLAPARRVSAAWQARVRPLLRSLAASLLIRPKHKRSR